MNIGERQQRFYGLVLIGGVVLSLILVLNLPSQRPAPALLRPRNVVQVPQFPLEIPAVKPSPRREGVEWAERINEQMMQSQQRWKALQEPSMHLAPTIRSTLPGGIEEGR